LNFLKPLKIVTTDKNEGFVEFVKGLSIETILREHKTIANYLQADNASSKEAYLNSIDRYTRSLGS
jgi:hypothetical protein